VAQAAWAHQSERFRSFFVKKQYLSNLKNTQVNFMHTLFGSQAAQSLVFKESRTLKEDSCVGVGSHRGVQSYGCTDIQRSLVFCDLHRQLLQKVVGIHDQK